MFGERRCGWHGEKSEEAIQIVGSRGNQIAIPFHHVCGFAQLIEHWAAVDHIDRMQPERKRSYDSEVSTTTTNRPEQIGVLVGICSDKFAVRKHHVG